jgi:hypothetical protein
VQEREGPGFSSHSSHCLRCVDAARLGKTAAHCKIGEIVRGLASGYSIGTVQIMMIVHIGIWTKQVAAFDWAGFASRVLNVRRQRH